MVLGYLLLFVGIGVLAQGWRELYRARRDNRLATGGLYSPVRPSQYTGLFVGPFGEGVVHWPTIFSVAPFPVIVLVYWLLARSEERRMIEEFGDVYRAYRRRVPMFIPQISQWRQCVERTSAAPSEQGLPRR